ncbi:Polyketide cyclase / dehydrase and lipid transport [Chitinophaga jiangningensis]|uniref:Polyketide cyclase / dehydrase and lipid transport n=1 Tax=Chitinophaga jiangningensis TaxID=1419482 RepID=A0A1M7C7C2_9BACT|nr:SRPBCC family protein [Chitinophaga jiangningensis]SHL63100.1 Polyketide cyclase / dehydrase and lipid transport [Chitinophaga jiangningensis]
MRFVKLGIISIIVFSTLIFLGSLLLPTTAVVERTGVIQAPIDSVYAHIGDLKAWEDWNPWFKPDTSATIQFSEQTSGTGAWYTWTGTRSSGKVTVLDSDTKKGIHYSMDVKNMKPVDAGIELKPTADGKATAIFWHMQTKLGMLPWWKLRGFMADKIFGPAMDKGLTTLSEICEGRNGN